jgi:hypothetical protein
MANINRAQYGEKVGRGATYPEQVAMWWLYFKWQWLRDAHGTMPALQYVLAFVFLGLGLLGGYVHWNRDRKTFWYFGPLMITMTLALIYYMNFKYGWSQNPGATDVQREVRDRDYFYIWSFSAWGVWAAIGLGFMWQQLADLIGARPSESSVRGRAQEKRVVSGSRPTRRALAFAAPILLIALVPLFANWSSASRAGNEFTDLWARDYLNSLEPYAIVISHGDNDTFPLWYAQEVEGVRRDVTVAVSTYLQTDWFVRQMIRKPVETYDAANGPALYRNTSWKKPVGPPLKMTFAEADAIPDYIQITEPQIFRKDKINLAIPPGFLVRDQLVLLRLIRDSFPERPIYVAAGTGEGLGLEPYLISQGLARKLVDHPLTDSAPTPKIGGVFVDVALSKALWDTVYRAPEALIEEGDWVDRASVSIPYFYAYTGAILAEAMSRRGDAKAASAIMSRVNGIATAARIGT